MKGILILICFLGASSILFGQINHRGEPFIVKGQIINSPEKELIVVFRDKNENSLVDTVRLDSFGKFYLKTYKVVMPQQVNIGNGKIAIRNIFAAPGYNITITGNAKDFASLTSSRKISGHGAQSNKYHFILDSLLTAKGDIKWFNLKENDFLSYIDKDRRIKDSILHIVFDKAANHDKYLKHFGTVIRIENIFNRLYRLLVYAYSHYEGGQATSFIRKHFDNKVLSNIYSEDYFISDYYKQIMAGDWLDYLLELDYRKDSSLRNKQNYNLEKVNKVYTGKIKNYTLYRRMNYDIDFSKSLSEVVNFRAKFEPFLSILKNTDYQELLEKKFSEMEQDLMGVQIGKPAPLFTLNDNFGMSHNLDDFKNKVVYLDFWASWCVPCREEIFSFKSLFDQYRNDARIAFISIAVNDEIANWRKAIDEDRPEWLQLVDSSGKVSSYYGANLIPRFVLIDKQGNIVNFDAPWPSEGQKLEILLNGEIAK